MAEQLQVDCLIIGAGIAGLWLLNRLQQAGFSALLLENNAIGSGQTIAAQGIIHGGTKYALNGTLNQTGLAVADMPALWRDCLAGRGELDLSKVKILSDYQYLWSTASLTSRLAAFLGSKTLHGKIQPLKRDQFPAAFQHPAFKGRVYQLQELVVDVPDLLQALAAPYRSQILQTRHNEIQYDTHQAVQSCQVELADGKKVAICAQRYILTAGAGNEALLSNAATQAPMQRRPLHMALVKHQYPIPLYAHCMIAHPKPRITITTHYTQSGQTVWYLGGLLAEKGVTQTESELIAAARAELAALFPWLDFATAAISGYRVDRAEPAQADGHLPGSTYSKQLHNLIVAWPTKLALAPKLAADILQALASQIKPQYTLANPLHLPIAPLASALWER